MQRSGRIGIIFALFLLVAILSAQGIGVSFSYFLPRNGWFSHPVPPLSVRDIGVDIGRYLGVAGSLSLYSIRGMGLKDEGGRPIESGDPLVGPFFTVLGSAVAKARIPLQKLRIEAGGGVFGCYNIDLHLMTGNLDRYLATATPPILYEAVSSSVSAGGHWGWGWVFGGRATYLIKGQIGISLGANYYIGGSDLRLSGSYDAYDGGAQQLDDAPLPPALRNARLDFTGLEIILGAEIEL